MAARKSLFKSRPRQILDVVLGLPRPLRSYILANGIDVHEAWNFENNPANMPLLGAMAERLRGTTQ